MSSLTFKELRKEYDRAKAAYLADPSYINGAYLNQVAAELDRRIKSGNVQ